MSFTLATYNVLAPSYAHQARYPDTPPEWLDSRRRIPALAEHLAGLAYDVLCLQEVEREPFTLLEEKLSGLGYAGDLCLKGYGKPDGCAMFYRTDRVNCIRRDRVEYADAFEQSPSSGHVAQCLVFRIEDHLLGVANTHLKWDPWGRRREALVGYRQVRELQERIVQDGSDCAGWIICGDLNVTVESEVVQTLQAAGYTASHQPDVHGATCNANRRARMLDFIFHTGSLATQPLPLPVVEDTTPLPGPDQPSDHVVVAAICSWR
jgi:mRNA deadenylase 3'-5' endonuclease subunit Ccr4